MLNYRAENVIKILVLLYILIVDNNEINWLYTFLLKLKSKEKKLKLNYEAFFLKYDSI